MDAMSILFERYPIFAKTFIAVAQNKLEGNIKCGCDSASRKPKIGIIDIKNEFISFKAKCMRCGKGDYYKFTIMPDLFVSIVKHNLKTGATLENALESGFMLATDLKDITYCQSNAKYESEFSRRLKVANKVSAMNDETKREWEKISNRNAKSLSELVAV